MFIPVGSMIIIKNIYIFTEIVELKFDLRQMKFNKFMTILTKKNNQFIACKLSIFFFYFIKLMMHCAHIPPLSLVNCNLNLKK